MKKKGEKQVSMRRKQQMLQQRTATRRIVVRKVEVSASSVEQRAA